MTSSRARAFLWSGIEGLWAAGFRLAGVLLCPEARRWTSPGGQRVLLVAPHPDDEVIGCGGTLLRHRQAGDRLAVACITDGRGLRATYPDPDAYVEQRRAEMEAAAALLGVERLDWLGLPEGAWAPEDLPPLLAGLLTDWAPDLLYLPSLIDYHPEHRKVAHAVALALGDAGGLPVRIYQVQVPLTAILVNLVADTSGVAPGVARALGAYASQRGNTRRARRVWRYAASLYCQGRSVEEFWEMPAAAYHALHRAPPGRWHMSTFRGLRRRPLTDPLAYLAGRPARRALARQLAAGARG